MHLFGCEHNKYGIFDEILIIISTKIFLSLPSHTSMTNEIEDGESHFSCSECDVWKNLKHILWVSNVNQWDHFYFLSIPCFPESHFGFVQHDSVAWLTEINHPLNWYHSLRQKPCLDDRGDWGAPLSSQFFLDVQSVMFCECSMPVNNSMLCCGCYFHFSVNPLLKFWITGEPWILLPMLNHSKIPWHHLVVFVATKVLKYFLMNIVLEG